MKPRKGSIIFVLLLIQILGLVTIWSTAPDLFATQFSFFVSSVIIIFLISQVDIDLLFSLSGALYVTSIILLLLTAVIGKNIRGSVRWIDLGFFNLQTSEIVKPLLAIFYSQFLSKNNLKSMKSFALFMVLAIIPVILVARQPDLGSALTLLFLPIALLSITGHLKRLLVIGVVAAVILIPLESKFLKPYQRQRIESFINPYKDPKGAGYNVIQATIAIGSGELWGKGVRLGTQSQLNYLPERHTDFIFASFAEEFGFLGIAVLFSAYYFLFSRYLRISSLLRQKSHVLLSLSVFFVFLFQTVVNIGMNLGVMPVTGITLPIFSYGGSSLLSFAILIGLELRLLDLMTPFEI
ncbi:MAG: Rod shape-determining protein RodA [Candidatus Collierbacteria bacterium GW2011_GWC1_45_47]|uniref:Rod shape-determining protein RodA n=6 Tax=Candidatus Collieribacteriota TaxID=1752725 RepID=A0A0G1KFU4_9BACT|nr:MAG: Rod shape-determining protein RodA [Candidatus Collierbacteria bacterium GW2011_GWA1_44_12]KKT37590.1 MAG: Rod shape-determining protein RodA [Candidatus Collierbacteria bacterium GW2011_GWF1_44_12]KKT46729.1 MAG: Rod shape-determining protein RodA [Candidatus Collierbacteria bacterium GW2011_GWF2_44_15]KKT67821.1 MAG: Rod shape-determining protein RodA [Candidatus Collierbacteria bacterium GW2011_GWB1_44_35]KKT98880.1 MAG: Rod shape-determining protein RodA [Candidatus Collierbacteria 